MPIDFEIMFRIAEIVIGALTLLSDRNAQYFKKGEWHYLWPWHQDK